MTLNLAAPSYEEFLRAKIALHADAGIASVAPADLHPVLHPHQRDAVAWMVRKGRCALFAGFGLGKTLMAIEAMRQLREHGVQRGLIVLPLGVRQEFTRDGASTPTDGFTIIVSISASVSSSTKWSGCRPRLCSSPHTRHIPTCGAM